MAFQDPTSNKTPVIILWSSLNGGWSVGDWNKRGDLIKRVSDCIISSGNHCTLDVSIDEGKWFAAKVIKEYKAVDDSGYHQNNTDVPLAPLAGWRPFRSQDIPSFFNYVIFTIMH